MYITTGSPLGGPALERLRRFLASAELDYDESITFTAMLEDDDGIIATGSLDGATVKCVAVSAAHQGEDLTARILTELFREAARRGIRHLMLYTKPHNLHLFAPLGFHPVIRTADCLLMENRRGGLEAFLNGLPAPTDNRGPVGCIVANANPFTLGHRYLIEKAASECAWVHVFILSEDKGLFSPECRLHLAREGCRDLKNVMVHPSGPYMVSSATFPTYFIKDKQRTGDIHCGVDVRLFGEKIAPALGITRRYVGSEPFCPVTEHYNRQLKALLPGYGVEVVEVERKTAGEQAISASEVRRLMAQNRFEALKELLPSTTLSLISSSKGELSCRIPTECNET